MKLGTGQLIYSQKSAMISALSLNFYPLMVKCSLALPHSYTQDGARWDIAANGFWACRFECTFFDVRVFNPHAPSNRHPCCYRKHELEKKCHYEKRALVLSATGGRANEATVFYKRFSSGLATKWDQPYSWTLVESWLRCRLTFSLLQSLI